jgi:N-acetylmuramoyl-L-alanine amidase
MCVACNFSRRNFLGMAAGLAATGFAAPAQARRRHPEVAKKLPLVMIDPGHGGHDPGAIADDGLQEKHITLATGLTLQKCLAATGRYRVAMTRSTDVFVTLEGRVAAAMTRNADLFLALHCDHLPVQNLRGASVFTLSNKASDKLSAGLADDENSADRFAAPGSKTMSPQLSNILASLETRATKLGSATLAQDIQTSFTGIVPLLPDPHRSANFAVLRDPSTPSALLEMGCLSNPMDERLLKSPSHRLLMAQRLTSAIDVYFSDHAGARLAG